MGGWETNGTGRSSRDTTGLPASFRMVAWPCPGGAWPTGTLEKTQDFPSHASAPSLIRLRYLITADVWLIG